MWKIYVLPENSKASYTYIFSRFVYYFHKRSRKIFPNSPFRHGQKVFFMAFLQWNFRVFNTLACGKTGKLRIKSLCLLGICQLFKTDVENSCWKPCPVLWKKCIIVLKEANLYNITNTCWFFKYIRTFTVYIREIYDLVGAI